MKFISVLGFFLFAATIHAQDLDRRPDAPKTNNLTAASATGSLVQDLIFPNTPIPDGMVWVPRGKVWHAEELNSCGWCSKPMTFRHAAFDRKMSSMWLLEVALMVTDTELGQACLRAGRCKESNPLLGTGSRSMQYGHRHYFGASTIAICFNKLFLSFSVFLDTKHKSVRHKPTAGCEQ